MSIFMKPNTKEYSVVDPIKPGYDKAIIKNDKIREEVRDRILEATSKISAQTGLEFDKIWILGSTLTHQWKDDSDIDVTIFLKDSVKPEDYKELNSLAAKKYNEKIYINQHPINFYFAKPRFLKYKADAIYDLINEKWIKKSEALTEDDVEEIIKNCSSLDEFNKIFEKYTELRNLLEGYDGKPEELMEIIEQTVKVSILFDKLKDKRREEFEKKPDPNLPSANYRCSNIVYKLLESYGLADVVEQVGHFLESRLEN